MDFTIQESEEIIKALDSKIMNLHSDEARILLLEILATRFEKNIKELQKKEEQLTSAKLQKQK